MKGIKFLFLGLMSFVLVLGAKAQVPLKVKIDSVPTTVAGFVKLRNEIAKKPQGGAAMFLLALKVYGENPDLGKKFLVLTVVKKHLVSGDFYKGYALSRNDMYLVNQIHKYPYVPNSYIKGAKPENDYKAELPYTYVFELQKSSGNILTDNVIKIFVKCYGADRTRPITVEKNDKGIWKVSEFSSVVVSVRPPKSKVEAENSDDL